MNFPSLTFFPSLQLNELVVGDTNGKLSVYKNDDSKPWTVRSCQGMVSWGRACHPSGFFGACAFCLPGMLCGNGKPSEKKAAGLDLMSCTIASETMLLPPVLGSHALGEQCCPKR